MSDRSGKPANKEFRSPAGKRDADRRVRTCLSGRQACSEERDLAVLGRGTPKTFLRISCMLLNQSTANVYGMHLPTFAHP